MCIDGLERFARESNELGQSRQLAEPKHQPQRLLLRVAAQSTKQRQQPHPVRNPQVETRRPEQLQHVAN